MEEQEAQSGGGGGQEQCSEEELLDREVQDSLCGLRRAASDRSGEDTASYHSAHTLQGGSRDGDSISTASFHSTDTLLQDCESTVDSLSTASFYSTGTRQGSARSPSSLSYCSLTSRVSVETLVVQSSSPTLGLGEDSSPTLGLGEEAVGSSSSPPSSPRLQQHREEYRRPGCLAGSAASATTGSSTSLASDSEVSLAGRVNEGVGRLLGYSGRPERGGVGEAMAAITGYETLAGEREKYTVYKLRIALADSVPRTWFIHRRYSDFLNLRSTLLKETPSTASRIPFPPKRWVGSNLEPAFLGRRLAGLQVFLATAMEDQELRSSPALGEFLCLDKRPHGGGGLDASRAVCDTLEETVKELREQLRKREQLEAELETSRNQNLLKDSQIAHLEKENDLLRQQKESLMTALSSGSTLNNSMQRRREKQVKGPGPRIESLEDFTVKFGLKSPDVPKAGSSPVRLRAKAREASDERRKSSIH